MGTVHPLNSTLAGRYRLVRSLGSGSRSEVFEAETPQGERVAVKVLTSQADPEDAERFRREALAASELRSPYIVPVTDHGIDDQQGPFLVMPKIDGGSLADVFRAGPLSPRSAVQIAMHVADGLAAAHARGVLHRDVKPSNVLLAQEPDGVRAMLCDFGMAKHQAVIDTLTRTGELLGTPMYMAPEQATDAKRATERSDVWGLGATLCHALAGDPLLHHVRSANEWFRALTVDSLPSLHEMAPWLDPDLVRVVHGMLIRDPGSRCPSARDARDVLRGWLAHHGSEDVLSLSFLEPSDRDRRTAPPSLPLDWREVSERDASATLLGRVDGRYDLVREIGSGGMGRVFEARADDGREVAVKLLRVDVQKGDSARRLLREAQSANGVDSPHVVHVMGTGMDESTGQPYLVLELLRGPDLASLIASEGPLDPSAAAWVFVRVCTGLAVAHERGLVHRDVKPSNIVLHADVDGSVVPKVCDFGIAKDGSVQGTSTSLTSAGAMLGSPLYMSPEQAQNPKNVSPQADVWSLCMSLYEALSGTHPWSSCTTVGEVLSALYTKDVPPLRSVAPWVGEGLEGVVRKGLQRRAEDRYASAAELREALGPFAAEGALALRDLRGVPIEVRATRSPQRVNHRRSIGLVALGGTALVIALAGWGTHRSEPSATPALPTSSNARAEETAILLQGSLAVRPADAIVRIDGAVVPVRDGVVRISSAAGATALVVVESGDRRTEQHVVMTTSGRLVPAVVDLTADPPPTLRTSDLAILPSAPLGPAKSSAPAARSPVAKPSLADRTPTHTTPEQPPFKTQW